MPLATISEGKAAPPAAATAALSAFNAASRATSSQRGVDRGELAYFSKKVLLPLGLTIASAAGLYLFYQRRKARREADEAEDMFKTSPSAQKQQQRGGRGGAQRSMPNTVSAAENDERRRALDDIMRILHGGPNAGGQGGRRGGGGGADGIEEHPFVRANRHLADQRERARIARDGAYGFEDDDDEDDEEEWELLEEMEEVEEDEDAYIDRFFEFEAAPEGFADARTHCLAAIEAAMALLEGRKPKKAPKRVGHAEGSDSEFEDEESNPDPILQVATQIEVDLRHRLAYFAQELGFSFFRDGEAAGDICATYAGPIPKPANMPRGGLSRKALLEGVREYLEVCAEIDRTKPIVVDLARQEAITGGRDKGAWRMAGDRDRDVDDAEDDDDADALTFGQRGKKGARKQKKSSGAKSRMDTFADDGDASDEDAEDATAATGPINSTKHNKEAAIGRMLAARERRFLGQHASAEMDAMLQEKQMGMMAFGDRMAAAAAARGPRGGAAGRFGIEGEDANDDDDDEFEDDDLDEDMAYIAAPLHDTNRRAFEAAVMRAVLEQLHLSSGGSSSDDPSAAHFTVLNTAAAQFKEPSEADDEEEEEEDGDADGWYGDDMFGFDEDGYGYGEDDADGADAANFFEQMGMGGHMGRMMGRMARGGPQFGDDADPFDDDYFDDEDDDDDPYGGMYGDEDEYYADEYGPSSMIGGGRSVPFRPAGRGGMMGGMGPMRGGPVGMGPMGMGMGGMDDEFDDAAFERMMQSHADRLREAAMRRGGAGPASKAKTKAKAPAPSSKKAGPSPVTATSTAKATSSGKNKKQQRKADVGAMLGGGDATDKQIAAMFLEDDEDEDEDDYAVGPMGGEDDDEREAFIREMIEREAAEYKAMRAADAAKKAAVSEGKSAKKVAFEEEEVKADKKAKVDVAPTEGPLAGGEDDGDDEEWESDDGEEGEEDDEWEDY